MAAIKTTFSDKGVRQSVIVMDLNGNHSHEIPMTVGEGQFLDPQLVCFLPGQLGILSVMRDRTILEFIPETATEYSPTKKR